MMNRVAIIGCGQLARMLALEGIRMGLTCAFVAVDGEETDAIADLVPTTRLLHWPGESPEALARFFAECVVVTTERESLPLALLDLAEFCGRLLPGRTALEAFSRRDSERALLQSLGLPVSPFRVVTAPADLNRLAGQVGFPVVIKSACDGYDGRGQWRAADAKALGELDLPIAAYPLLVERQIRFVREISLTAVRSSRGEVGFYPMAENRHHNGILVSAQVPARAGVPRQAQAREWMHKLLGTLDYVGVLTMELFETEDGLLINEIAPRVHNSAHWTLGGAMTSQFENHWRALLGLPLGSTEALGVCGIVNILGSRPPVAPDWLRGNMRLHDYSKQERPGRKLGHVLVMEPGVEVLEQTLAALQDQLRASPDSQQTRYST